MTSSREVQDELRLAPNFMLCAIYVLQQINIGDSSTALAMDLKQLIRMKQLFIATLQQLLFYIFHIFSIFMVSELLFLSLSFIKLEWNPHEISVIIINSYTKSSHAIIMTKYMYII